RRTARAARRTPRPGSRARRSAGAWRSLATPASRRPRPAPPGSRRASPRGSAARGRSSCPTGSAAVAPARRRARAARGRGRGPARGSRPSSPFATCPPGCARRATPDRASAGRFGPTDRRGSAGRGRAGGRCGSAARRRPAARSRPWARPASSLDVHARGQRVARPVAPRRLGLDLPDRARTLAALEARERGRIDPHDPALARVLIADLVLAGRDDVATGDLGAVALAVADRRRELVEGGGRGEGHRGPRRELDGVDVHLT